MRRSSRDPDGPSLDPPDILEVTAIEHPYRFDDADPELELLVVETVNRMGGVGEDAEQRYQEGLERLRSRASDVVHLLFRDDALAGVAEEQYLDRWALVQLLAELVTEEALPVFDMLLSAALPDERSEDPHSFSTQAEELMIRTAAVDGLERLSEAGSDAARRLLVDHATADRHFSVRRACTQALMATGTPDHVSSLRERLQGSGDEALLRIRRVDVRRVEQAEGGLFLASTDRNDLPPAAPDQ